MSNYAKILIRGNSIIKQSYYRMSSLPKYSFETLLVTCPQTFVYKVEINNPSKKNAMKRQFWKDIRECMSLINDDTDCRCVVLAGVGPTFSAGIDVTELGGLLASLTSDDPARRAFQLRRIIVNFQSSFTSLEQCLKPVIAAVHGPCVGAAVDMVCAADIRMASEDAWFQVKEVAMGLAADVGTIQRLPRLVGSDSLARELIYSARKMAADEALRCGLVSEVLSSKDALLERAMALASTVAEMSPVAVQSSKAALVYSRDHTVEEGLRMQADWNQVMLQSEDLVKAVMAGLQKEKADYDKM